MPEMAWGFKSPSSHQLEPNPSEFEIIACRPIRGGGSMTKPFQFCQCHAEGVHFSSRWRKTISPKGSDYPSKTIYYDATGPWHEACWIWVQERDMSIKKTDIAIRLLTLAEAASILKISKRTLHRMIQQKQIPAFKVGGQWRILESRFQEWVQEEESSSPKLN